MKFLSSIFIVLILTTTAFTFGTSGYTITGSVTGLPDGTWLYLRSSHPDKEFDSCRVQQGKFSMAGRITEKAIPVYLHTEKYTNYVHFWLENANITITVRAGEFKKGTIKGSATQDEDDRLDRLRKPLNQRIDSVTELYRSTKQEASKKKLYDQLAALEEQSKQLEIKIVSANAGSLVAANILNIYATSWGRSTVQELYNKLTPELKETRYGHEISEYLALAKEIKIGGPFADFEQESTTGKKLKLSDIKAKYILLDFWASWCGPCREENPNLVNTYNRYKDNGFAVMGVSLDDNRDRWLKAVEKDKLVWENVSDLQGDKNRVALMYGINAIPSNFLIDANGIIIAKDLRGSALDEKLKELLP